MNKENSTGKDFVRDLGDTFSDIGQKIGSKFNQLMDDLNTEDTHKGEVRVPIDVYETTKALMIEAEIPGVPKTAVSLKATGNVLNISGEKKEDDSEKLNRRSERRYGSFSRLITLPEDGLKMDKIGAKFSDGILTITIPKLKPAPPKSADEDDLTVIDIQ